MNKVFNISFNFMPQNSTLNTHHLCSHTKLLQLTAIDKGYLMNKWNQKSVLDTFVNIQLYGTSSSGN